MCKHWGLHISTDIDCLEVVLGSFWAVWRGILMSLEPKLRSWQFPRYWWFNKWYHDGYQLICLISQPLLIASRRDWYWSKGLFKGFWVPLKLWESLKNWWIYGWMKFVTSGLRLIWHQDDRSEVYQWLVIPSLLDSVKKWTHCWTTIILLTLKHTFMCF